MHLPLAESITRSVILIPNIEWSRHLVILSSNAVPVLFQVLKKKGYRNLTCQIGNGSFVPEDGIQEGVTISHFRFSDNIVDAFKTADLVISHAGAGTCLEVIYQAIQVRLRIPKIHFRTGGIFVSRFLTLENLSSS